MSCKKGTPNKIRQQPITDFFKKSKPENVCKINEPLSESNDIYVIDDSPPSFSATPRNLDDNLELKELMMKTLKAKLSEHLSRKRKSSTKTEATSPQKIIKTSADQIIDTSHISITSSSNSTVIYECNADITGQNSIFEQSTEKLNVIECSSSSPKIGQLDLSNLIKSPRVDLTKLTDVPLSPRSKCLNWNITKPEAEQIVELEAVKAEKDLEIPTINISESSNDLIRTPVKLLIKQETTESKISIAKSINKGFNKATLATNTPTKYTQTTLFGKNNSAQAQTPTTTSDNSTISSENQDQDKHIVKTKILKAISDLFNNFKSIKSLKDLLSPEERKLMYKFEMMNDNQQYIVIKMYTRKRKWHDIVKFCETVNIEYTNDIGADFNGLLEQKVLEYFKPDPESIRENLEQLDLAKIKDIVTNLKVFTKNKTKKNMIEGILNECNTKRTLTKKTFKDVVLEKIAKKFGKAVRIKDEVVKAFDHFCLLSIFTNSTFENIHDYLRKFNDTVFPEAPIVDFPIFYSRDKFLEYAAAIELQEKLEVILETFTGDDKLTAINEIAKQSYNCLSIIDNNNDHVNEPHLNRLTAAHAYSKLLSSCCDKLFAKKTVFTSQVKQWLEFLIDKYPDSKRQGKWYHKLIGLHMRHLETINYETAAMLLIEVLSMKRFCLGERIFYELGLLGRSLINNKKRPIDQTYRDQIEELIPSLIDIDSIPSYRFSSPLIPSTSTGRKRMYTRKFEDGVTISNVETLALLEYNKNGYPNGEHSEGSHIHNLLVLYFWDIIYNEEETIDHTFISKFQSAPLDMFTEHFYTNRQNAIDKRLNEIDYEWSEEKLLEFGITNWEAHSHKCSVFGTVQSVIDKEIVRELLEVIGRKVLAKIFQRLIKNLGEYKSGMPDLLVWNTKTKTHKFVEVKSENDRLAAHQTLWLVYLKEVGANVEICYVDN